MKSHLWLLGTLALGIWGVYAYDPTDSLMDADSAQSGYLPNHNMDPAVLAGGTFGQIWSYTGVSESFYAKPLVYTPSSLGRQMVLAFSEGNKIYALDAINGTKIAYRDLALGGESPFKVSDLPSCNDIGGTVGITGTPVIDPTTDTIYFWAKGYLSSGQTGYMNAAYRFHAVDAATLAERPGFPIGIQNLPADNDKTRLFTGGTHLQRTSLNLINGAIYSGFGAHCDLFNYTGWVIGMSTSGKVLSAYVTVGGPYAPPQDGTWNGGGGGAGIWMGGAALASDNSGRLFFATGNAKNGIGYNNAQSSSGRIQLDVLSECIVNLGIDPKTGGLTQNDYFEPAAYAAMDAGDRDLGSGGVILPDPTVFSGGGVARIAIACGKNSQCYIVNADNLGGYKMGTSGGDAVLQTLSPPSGGSIFGNVGTYPLEGGYLYVNSIGSPTYVYSLGFDSNGRPAFTLVGQTDDSSTGSVGVGPPTITTLKGQLGTAILWIADKNGMRAYNAVPVNGKMTKIALPAVNSISKFQRPAFGNGRYYVISGSGVIMGFGAPVSLPLSCSSPVEFGSLAIGSSTVQHVNCTANTLITNIKGLIIGSDEFKASNKSLPNGPLAAGYSFSFPVTFDLTNYSLTGGSTSAPEVKPGVQTTALTIYTVNGATGFSTQVPITLTGDSVSQKPFLQITPLQVTFPGIVVGSSSTTQQSTSTFIINNVGQSDAKILGYVYSNDASDSSETNVTVSTSSALDDPGVITASNLPAIGTIIPAGSSVTISVAFSSKVTGNYFTLFKVYSNGGNPYTILTGTASTAPIALFEQSTSEGGWTTISDCTIPSQGCLAQIDMGTISTSITLRFTNKGGSDLVITKSKPPGGSGAIIGATNPTTEFSEGLIISSGKSATASVYFTPPNAQLNSDPKYYSAEWTINVNDLLFGVHVLNFTGTLLSPQVGPLFNNGSAQFRYLGCYKDSTGQRIEPNSQNSPNNTNGLCQNNALTSGYAFAGTEYQTECWIGAAIPPANSKAPDSQCTGYKCPGDNTQYCGGSGGYLAMYYDCTKYDLGSGAVSDPATTTLTDPHNIELYSYVGCWTDSPESRSLSIGSIGTSSTMSLENCVSACQGYSLFGTEYGQECYCGNGILESATQKPDSDCSMVCTGNNSEYCGNGNRLSLYFLNNTGASIPTIPTQET